MRQMTLQNVPKCSIVGQNDETKKLSFEIIKYPQNIWFGEYTIKSLSFVLSPAGMSLTKLSLAVNL
jgi:hypothetical protein